MRLCAINSNSTTNRLRQPVCHRRPLGAKTLPRHQRGRLVDPLPAGPEGPGAPFLGTRGFMVNAQSENRLLAEAFLTELIASDEFMAEIQAKDPRIPAWIPTYEAMDDVDLAGFRVVTPYAQPMPNIRRWVRVAPG